MAHQPSARPAVPPPSQAASNAAAALQGANLAFARTTAPRPMPPVKRVPNGALYAAATASTRDRSRSRSPAPSQSRQTTGGTDGTTEHARWPRLASSPPPAARLSPPSAAKPTSYDTKSPSYIAATLAASRSASPSPNANTPVPGLPVARRKASVNSLSGGSSLDLPDTSSIAPTTNLISMFEMRDDNGDGDDDDVEPTKKKTPVRRPTAMRRVPQLRAMTPERESSPKGRRTPPVRDPGSPVTEETTPTARPKPRVKPKLRPMTPERKMSPDRREPGSPLRSEITPPSKPKPRVKARPRPAETEARAPSPPKPMRAVMAPLRLTQRHAPETRSPQPQKGQPVPDVSLRPSAPESTSKTDRSDGQALAAKSKPPPSPIPTPASPKPVVVPKTLKHRPESVEMPPPRIISRSETAVLSPVPTRPASQAKLRPPTPPQPRGASSTAKPAAPPPRATAPLPVNDANLAALSNGRRVSTTARPTTSGTSSSNETFVSASSTQTPRPASPVPRRELPPRPSSTISMPVGSPTRPYTPSLPRRHPAAVSTSSLPQDPGEGLPAGGGVEDGLEDVGGTVVQGEDGLLEAVRRFAELAGHGVGDGEVGRWRDAAEEGLVFEIGLHEAVGAAAGRGQDGPAVVVPVHEKVAASEDGDDEGQVEGRDGGRVLDDDPAARRSLVSHDIEGSTRLPDDFERAQDEEGELLVLQESRELGQRIEGRPVMIDELWVKR
ncbi:hypothetical protein BN1723_009097 [Verticillium longisporum]|uniref:Uncharacterized protein n=1 Tax=Verticillium longisporum TaxID=100787 RepID=A0A0G4KLW3_VERLO|nr:hypothetical protein BN1723_009097 [Verticillium longisporum]